MAHGADGLDVRLVAPADQGDDARDPAGLDVPRQHLAHLAQTFVGEAAVAAGHVDPPRPVVFMNFRTLKKLHCVHRFVNTKEGHGALNTGPTAPSLQWI